MTWFAASTPESKEESILYSESQVDHWIESIPVQKTARAGCVDLALQSIDAVPGGSTRAPAQLVWTKGLTCTTYSAS